MNSMENDNSTVSFITYILLLTVEIPSFLCTIFILIFFFFNWRLMMIKVLHNHIIFLLINISALYITLDLPFTINYYRIGYDIFRTRSFCLWWYWLDYTLLTTSLFLTATASIQRYILVFHASWLQGSRKRWILHYIPLSFCIIYLPLFYSVMIFFYPCVTLSDQEYLVCPFPCYGNNIVLLYIDWIIHVISPVVVIVLANLFLLCRVIYAFNKFRRPQTRIWRKRRKLILQFFGFSILYIIGWGPLAIISVVQILLLPDLYNYAPNLYYINSSTYCVNVLQPFICFFALPELLKLIKRTIKRRRTMINATTSTLADTHI